MVLRAVESCPHSGVVLVQADRHPLALLPHHRPVLLLVPRRSRRPVRLGIRQLQVAADR